ncbi:MAG: uracil-DNA glycosylase, partial [Rhodobacteraceae bacterium]|nr:uracil-DNA glycosylase [Paracoccaceae bacterium]
PRVTLSPAPPPPPRRAGPVAQPAVAAIAAPDLPAGLAAPASLSGEVPLEAAVAEARAAADAADSLEALAAALAAYPHCDLRLGARNTVFADGLPGAPVMIVGEAPGREEDLEGRPFVGRAGRLLDRMFAAIGLGRAAEEPRDALYITNVMPWRPPGNRDPGPAEIAMMRPFLDRHITLAAPRLLVPMGNTPCLALLGRKGILRMRGTWAEVAGLPALPMTHPAYLLRNPGAKREAWADLLAIEARLERPA